MSTINVTFSTEDGRSEQLPVMANLGLGEVKSFVEAMLGVPAGEQKLILNGRELPSDGTLASAGVKDQDLVMVVRGSGNIAATAGTRTNAATRSSQPPPSAPANSGTSRGGGNGSGPVFWDGMTLDDVMENNKKPEHIVDILKANPRIVQELRFHNPKLAQSIDKDRNAAVSDLRMHLMMQATKSTLNQMSEEQKVQEMERRLAMNPMDEEANKFFGERIREQQVQESYMQMMQHYPESLASKVLMLYIEVKINGVPIQAFVDSGAQTSVMSGKCAEKCGVARLIDKRFAGKVVGVGTGSTLGRVHLCPMEIDSNFFNVSLTVMDDSQGLGDRNMEMLLGLDMLKRHRCSIDLAQGKLFFHGASGVTSTPFLHEKDLPVEKGGTRGFNPNAITEEDFENDSSSSSSTSK